MPRTIQSPWLAGPAGRLEAVLEEPGRGAPRLAAVLCHPHPLYGGTMHNKVVYRMARGLRRSGAAVLRFNFRGVGLSEGVHAHGPGEVEDARAALDWLRASYPSLPFALAGFSFGARVIMELGCSVNGACFLMGAGFPTRLGGLDQLESCRVPKVFIQSTHDEYAPRAEFERAYAAFSHPRQLTWIEAPDHFFSGSLDDVEAAVVAPVPALILP